MIGGSALSSRAIGDATRRDLSIAWGGPESAPPQAKIRIIGDADRCVAVRKP